MPRRNLRCLFLVSLVSLVCFQKVPQTRYSRVLAGAMDHVCQHFYLPVDERKLFEGAMSGMVEQLGDEHSKYIQAAKKPEFEQDLNQEFVGIGVIPAVDPKTKAFLVLTSLPGGPAFAAGIRAGDHIEKIEGESTQGLSLEDAVQRIRGKPGTPVRLTIRHADSERSLELAIVRAVIHEDSVQGESRDAEGQWKFMLPGSGRIGYLRIVGFSGEHAEPNSTAADVRAALEKLRDEKIRGLVLDLRDNRGGSLRSAVNVCDMLVPKGEIVTTRGRDGQILEAFRASGKAEFTGFPVAVLVNCNSASAAEIVAACLQDNNRAIVVGERSYGKGTVQEVLDMGHSLGEIKLTIATYWRPSGQNINRTERPRPAVDHGKRESGSRAGTKEDSRNDAANAAWGVSPNEGFDVPVGDDERERLLAWRRQHELAELRHEKGSGGEEVRDRVLLKAVEYLESKTGD